MDSFTLTLLSPFALNAAKRRHPFILNATKRSHPLHPERSEAESKDALMPPALIVQRFL